LITGPPITAANVNNAGDEIEVAYQTIWFLGDGLALFSTCFVEENDHFLSFSV
jgi:hypothetical protein